MGCDTVHCTLTGTCTGIGTVIGTGTGTGTITVAGYLNTGIRNGEQARLDAVLVLRHGGLLGAGRDILGAVDDHGGEGAGHAGLQRHRPLAEETGKLAGVGGEAEQHVEELQVRGQGELDLIEVHELHDGSEVVVSLRPSLAVGQHQDAVDARVHLTLLLSSARCLGSGVPGQRFN